MSRTVCRMPAMSSQSAVDLLDVISGCGGPEQRVGDADVPLADALPAVRRRQAPAVQRP